MQQRDDPESTLALFEGFLAHEPDAEHEFCKRLSEQLSRIAAKQIGKRLRRNISESDVVQTAMRSFIRNVRKSNNARRFDHAAELWAYLITIMVNKIRTAGRKMRVEYEELPDLPSDEPAPDVKVIFEDLISVALDDLDEIHATEIVAYVLQDYSVADIGEELDRSRWTVHRRLVRIGERLKRLTEAEL